MAPLKLWLLFYCTVLDAFHLLDAPSPLSLSPVCPPSSLFLFSFLNVFLIIKGIHVFIIRKEQKVSLQFHPESHFQELGKLHWLVCSISFPEVSVNIQTFVGHLLPLALLIYLFLQKLDHSILSITDFCFWLNRTIIVALFLCISYYKYIVFCCMTMSSVYFINFSISFI